MTTKLTDGPTERDKNLDYLRLAFHQLIDITNNVPTTCPRCSGREWIELHGVAVWCPECGGSGYRGSGGRWYDEMLYQYLLS